MVLVGIFEDVLERFERCGFSCHFVVDVTVESGKEAFFLDIVDAEEIRGVTICVSPDDIVHRAVVPKFILAKPLDGRFAILEG